MKIQQILMPAVWGKRFDRPAQQIMFQGGGQSSVAQYQTPPVDQVQFGWRRDNNKRFHRAALRNQVDTLEQLLAQGVPVDTRDQYGGQTPLMTALNSHAYEAAEYLLSKGASIELKDNEGWTVLMYHLAFKSPGRADKQTELTPRLIHKPLINARDYFKQATALVLATEKGMQGSALALIAAGADVTLPDRKGMTPLMYAVWNNQPDTALQLIQALPPDKRQAYVNATNTLHRTAMDIARGSGNKAMIRLLIQNGGTIHQPNPWEDDEPGPPDSENT